ncbi:MAG: glycosyltransferase [Candidatus Solibacter usitatus]|nr:glycosyltransferase [Candidatus Solibacter usitatus]
MLWFWVFVAPALILAAAALWGERARAAYISAALAAEPATSPLPATVIVPVTRGGPELRGALASLRAQDYPSYELLVVAAGAQDIPAGALPSGVIVVLPDGATAGATDLLLTAIRVSRKNTQLLAFAGGSGEYSQDWLRALAAPLAREEVGASTGYRWFLPEPPDFWSLLRSVWNAPLAGLFGPGNAPFAWSGSFAIRRDIFFEARVPDFWKESPDCARGISAAMRAAQLTIAYAPAALVAFNGRVRAAEFFRSALKEMIDARTDHPRLWWQAFAFYALQCGAMAAALAASIKGSRGAEWALVAQWGLTMLKGTNYAILAKAQLPARKAWFDRFAWVHSVWVPLAMWMWLAVMFSSLAFRNKRV